MTNHGILNLIAKSSVKVFFSNTSVRYDIISMGNEFSQNSQLIQLEKKCFSGLYITISKWKLKFKN